MARVLIDKDLETYQAELEYDDGTNVRYEATKLGEACKALGLHCAGKIPITEFIHSKKKDHGEGDLVENEEFSHDLLTRLKNSIDNEGQYVEFYCNTYDVDSVNFLLVLGDLWNSL